MRAAVPVKLPLYLYTACGRFCKLDAHSSSSSGRKVERERRKSPARLFGEGEREELSVQVRRGKCGWGECELCREKGRNGREGG